MYEGGLWHSTLKMAASPSPMSITPAFSPGPGPRDYLLAVGAIQRRKNQLAALEAAAAVGMPLVVVGPEGKKIEKRTTRPRTDRSGTPAGAGEEASA